MAHAAQSRGESVAEILADVRMNANLLTVMAKVVVVVTQIIHIEDIIKRVKILNEKEVLVA